MEAQEHVAITITDGIVSSKHDSLAPEAPLHIKVNGESYITTMRTPNGFDPELAHGLLFTEGITKNLSTTVEFSTVNDPETQFAAQLNATIDPNQLTRDISNARNQMSTASCGICGTREPAALELDGEPLAMLDETTVDSRVISAMFEAMHGHQALFLQTGGTHGASAFTRDGTHLATHEDIGRHNAVDKVIGALVRNEYLTEAHVMTVSSRVSYEIVTKAYRARIPILAAVSAPSTMAVETAQAFGITLAAFCRDERISIYSHPERIAQSASKS